MRFYRLLVTFPLLFLPLLCPAEKLNAQEKETASLEWSDWTPQLFEKARSENRFVILDLEAVWCHWCHVMEQTTYQDSKVMELLQSKYIPVRVDQDSHPELSSRYEDYGWPATVIFDANGQEIVKRRGYIPPALMSSLLQAVIDDPTPGPSILAEIEVKPSENAFLTPKQSEKIRKEHQDIYDEEFGGWGELHKLIDASQWEYAFSAASENDAEEKQRAVKTLDQALLLLDPVWGGFYQYSDTKDWKSPHFEKIMSIQGDYLRIYSLGFMAWGKPEYLEAAKKTADYLKNFLTSPEGAFYTSQDADISSEITGHDFYGKDDESRKKLGLPRIDKNIYARENGWAIQGLAALYQASGNEIYLNQAKASADWILLNRPLPAGGFRHGEKDRGGPYLGDTLSMGRAFLALYGATGDRVWLQRAEDAANFIETHLKDTDGGGYITSPVSEESKSVFKNPVKRLEENVGLARFVNLLSFYSGKKSYRDMAEHAMRYLASPDLLENKRFLAGILLTDLELAREPIHITIVGSKENPSAKELFKAAIRYPASYKRVEWWDKKEGPMPNPDVQYPELPKPAAFACADKTCSLPLFDPAKIPAMVDRIRQAPE